MAGCAAGEKDLVPTLPFSAAVFALRAGLAGFKVGLDAGFALSAGLGNLVGEDEVDESAGGVDLG